MVPPSASAKGENESEGSSSATLFSRAFRTSSRRTSHPLMFTLRCISKKGLTPLQRYKPYKSRRFRNFDLLHQEIRSTTSATDENHGAMGLLFLVHPRPPAVKVLV